MTRPRDKGKVTTPMAGSSLSPAHRRLVQLLAQAYVDQLEGDVTQGKAPETAALPGCTEQEASENLVLRGGGT